MCISCHSIRLHHIFTNYQPKVTKSAMSYPFFFQFFFSQKLVKNPAPSAGPCQECPTPVSHGFRMSSEAMQGWKASKPWLCLLARPLNSGSREPVGRIIQEKPRDSSTPVVLRLAGHCSCRTPEQNQGWEPWKTSPDEGSVL